MAISGQFSPQRSALLESSKIAFLQYVTDRKQPLHNYQQRSIFWDQQHLYNQNLMLRYKIKQMTENNTKTKTQLLKSEKELIDMASKKIKTQIIRSSSTHQIGKEKELSVFKFRVDVLKEQKDSKRLLAIKMQIRKLKEQVQSLQAENVQLKKSIKYTRITQLQVQNKQLQEQILRVGKIAVNFKEMQSQLYKNFVKEKEEMSYKIRKEVEARFQANRQLKRLKLQLEEIKSKQKNKNSDKKLHSQISYLQQQNSELKDVLEINMKNNSQLKQTLQSYIKNSNLRENESNITKLQYSASVFSQYPPSDNKLNNSLKKVGLQSDLTSLQLLTPNSSLQDFKSPQKTTNLKFQQKIYEVPRYQEEDNRPLVNLQKSTNSVTLEQRYMSNYQSIPNKQKDSSSEYEYILQDF